MGGHAHACQAFFFQEVDLVNQGSHLRSFEQSRLFTPSSLELGKSAYERKGGWVRGSHSRTMFRAIPEENFSPGDQEK
jgi:hypothetical protein